MDRTVRLMRIDPNNAEPPHRIDPVGWLPRPLTCYEGDRMLNGIGDALVSLRIGRTSGKARFSAVATKPSA